MKKYCGILLLSTFLLQFSDNSGESPKPTFPSSFFVKSKNPLFAPFSSVWFDGEKKFLRTDSIGGVKKTMIKKENETKATILNLVPMRHKDYCIEDSNRYSTDLPDYFLIDLSTYFMSYFKFVANETLGGVNVEKWHYENPTPYDVTVYLQYKNSVIDPKTKVVGFITVTAQTEHGTLFTEQLKFDEQKLDIEALQEPFKNITCVEYSSIDWKRIHSDINETKFSIPEQVYKSLPNTFDWRKQGFVIHNDDLCRDDSSWSCVIAANAEGAYFAQKNRTSYLSSQALMDCAASVIQQIDIDHAYEWIIQNGGVPEQTRYPGPRTGQHETCKISNTPSAFTINGFGTVPSNSKTHLKAALVHYGPISAQLEVHDIEFLRVGDKIYNGVPCGETAGYAGINNYYVLIVGYGVENGREYIIVNPFLGINFGQEGYAKVSLERDHCNIQLNEARFINV